MSVSRPRGHAVYMGTWACSHGHAVMKELRRHGHGQLRHISMQACKHSRLVVIQNK